MDWVVSWIGLNDNFGKTERFYVIKEFTNKYLIRRWMAYLKFMYFLQTKLNDISNRFPLINNVVQRISLRKRRDTIIIGSVIGLCLVFLLWYWLGWQNSDKSRSIISLFTLWFITCYFHHVRQTLVIGANGNKCCILNR